MALGTVYKRNVDLTAELEVEPAQAEADLSELIGQLSAADLIVEVL